MSTDTDPNPQVVEPIEGEPVGEPTTDPQVAEPTTGESGGEPGSEPEGDPPAEPEGDPPADPQQLMKWARDTLGVSDQTGKYSDDAAFLRAFDNQSRMLGQRDEDAQLGKQLRASGRQDELLGTKQPEAPAVAPKGEIKLLEQLVRALGDDAPKELVDKLRAARDQASDTMHQLMADPEEFLRPHMEKMRQGILDSSALTLQQQSAAQQIHTDMQQLGRENPWMFADGKPPAPGQAPILSPEGEQLNTRFMENEQRYAPRYDETGNMTQAGFNKAQILSLSLDMHVRDQAAQRKPTRTPNKKARHTPDTATTIPDQTPPKGETFRQKMVRKNDERIAREQGEAR